MEGHVFPRARSRVERYESRGGIRVVERSYPCGRRCRKGIRCRCSSDSVHSTRFKGDVRHCKHVLR